MLSITRSYFMQLFCQSGLMGRAQQAIDGAEAAIAPARRGEEMHLETAGAWLEDVAARLRAGMVQKTRATCWRCGSPIPAFLSRRYPEHAGSLNRVMYASPSVPAYGFVQGMQAFGFEESGNYAAGEAAGAMRLKSTARTAGRPTRWRMSWR